MSKWNLATLFQRFISSQQRTNDAMIGDLVTLNERVRKLEGYVELIEARRNADLQERAKKK